MSKYILWLYSAFLRDERIKSFYQRMYEYELREKNQRKHYEEKEKQSLLECILNHYKTFGKGDKIE